MPPRNISVSLELLIKQHHLPGMVAAVVRGTNIDALGAAGVRQRGRPEAITIADQFEINSETKSMTATVCAMLVEKGLLRWDSTLAEVFPGLKSKMLPELSSVTLEQLLTQRSGFVVKSSLNDWKRLATLKGTPVEMRQTLLEQIVTKKPDTAPGDRFTYNNLNYAVAGHMAEMATGQSWEDLMQVQLFVPLDMTSAGFGPPGQIGVFNQPRGHQENGEPTEPGSPDEINVPPALAPAGAVHCSVLDWAKYTAFHATEGQSHPGLLKRESFAILHAPAKTNLDEPNLKEIAPTSIGYAMGWIVFPGTTLVHSGSNGQWMAKLAVIPKDQLSVLVLCNQGGDEAENACNEALLDLIKDCKKTVQNQVK